MTLGIDPKVDYAFKWLFGNEKNAPLLIHLLNAVLDLAPGEQIAEVRILNPFSEKMSLDEKLSILDIKARDQRGRQFNVEMQMLAPPSLPQRILYYWAKLYTEQLPKGDDYHLLRPTISICFVDGVVFPEVPQHHLSFRLRDSDHDLVLTDDLAIHFVELPKFKLDVDQLATPLDTWIYFIRHAEGLDPEALPGPLDAGEIRQAVETLMVLSEIDIQKEIYEGRIKARRDQLMWERAAARAHEKALAEGLAQGHAQGHAQGRAQGVLIGQIQLAQRVLRQAVTPREDLEAMPTEALEALAAKLERELPQ